MSRHHKKHSKSILSSGYWEHHNSELIRKVAYNYRKFRQNGYVFLGIISLLLISLIPYVPTFLEFADNLLTGILDTFDIIIFIILLAITLKCSWYSLLKINQINLVSDLNIWGLRIVSFILIFIGGIIGWIGSMLVSFNNSYYTLHIFWIIGISIIILSAFAMFRFNRRYDKTIYFR